MVCHICLAENVNKKIDRLDLCNECFIRVEKETARVEKELAKNNKEKKNGSIKSG